MQVVDPPLVKTLTHPVGGLTSLSSGTASFDPHQWLHQLGAAGLTPHDLVEMVRAVEAAAREEEEATAFMAKFRKNVTGVDNTIFFSVEFARHKPRIKVAIDPPTHVDPSSDGNASVAIADGSHLAGEKMPSWLRKQVEWFLEVNRDTLMDYWNKRLDDDELRERLLANKDRVEAGRPR
jgi:hypothetical protein